MDKLPPFLKLKATLENVDDLELALLKSHLIVEEALTDVISSKSQNPKYVVDSRLSFAQKCSLARALYDEEVGSLVWPAIKQLNKARNLLAHRLETEKIEAEISLFINIVRDGDEVWGADALNLKNRDLFFSVYLVANEIRALIEPELLA